MRSFDTGPRRENDSPHSISIRRNQDTRMNSSFEGAGMASSWNILSGTHRTVMIAAFSLGCAALASAQDAKVVKGEKVFTDQKCTLCHSIGGHGNPKGPLDDVGSKLTADEIRQWITDAKGMSAKTQ